jgi:hypothetical protein
MYPCMGVTVGEPSAYTASAFGQDIQGREWNGYGSYRVVFQYTSTANAHIAIAEQWNVSFTLGCEECRACFVQSIHYYTHVTP